MNKKQIYTPFSDVLKESWRIYSCNIFIWLEICLFIYVPMSICNNFIPSNLPMITDIFVQDYSFKIKLITILANFTPFVLFQPLGIAAVSCVVFYKLNKKKVTLEAILDASLMKWFDLIACSILYYSIIVISLSLVFPALYFGIVFYFYAVVISTTNFKGFNAMRISHTSLYGRNIRAAFVIALSKFIEFVIEYGISYAVHTLPIAIRNDISTKVLSDVLLMFLNIFLEVFVIVWFMCDSLTKLKVDIMNNILEINISKVFKKNKKPKSNKTDDDKLNNIDDKNKNKSQGDSDSNNNKPQN